MNTYTIRINFVWDDGDDTRQFKLFVPSNVTEPEITDILSKEHEYLCKDDEEDFYGTQGRCPETLLNYVCEKYNWQWQWQELELDIDLNFD
jgi:hypothetical protein